MLAAKLRAKLTHVSSYNFYAAPTYQRKNFLIGAITLLIMGKGDGEYAKLALD